MSDSKEMGLPVSTRKTPETVRYAHLGTTVSSPSGTARAAGDDQEWTTRTIR